MLFRLLALLLVFAVTPVMAQQRATLDLALDAAIATFVRALPRLASREFGVDVAAYRDALSLQRFHSAHWSGGITVDLSIRDTAQGSCTRFAAFVRIPPENGAVRLVLCPQFFSDGADALRELTLLHEMVHVVAGADECRAMAFAARIQQAAGGNVTPVARYWQANDCDRSGFSLPGD